MLDELDNCLLPRRVRFTSGEPIADDTMEDPISPTQLDTAFDEQFVQRLDLHRSEAQEYLSGQQELLANLDGEIADQIQVLVEQQQSNEQGLADLSQRLVQVEQDERELESLRTAFEASRQEYRLDTEQLVQQQTEFEQAQQRLEDDRQRLADERAKTCEQRRRIAHKLKNLHAREQEKIEADLEKRIAQLDQQAEDNQRQAADLEQQKQAIEEQLEAAEQAARTTSESDADSEELEQLRGQVDVLTRALEQAELKAGDVADDEKYSELQSRFELVLADLRELKSRNADLEEELSQSLNKRTGASETPDLFDWEAQKQKMLDSLDDDFDDDDQEEHQERLTIEGTISITDEVVAKKDCEIAELKQLLNDQSNQLGTVAVGATAIGEIFNQDALILQERERLREQQDEWREKLRKAEVDISIERAKIAREKLELEGKLRDFAADKAGYIQSESQSSDRKQAGAKPTGRRWLSRLGLKDSGDEG